MGIRGMESYLEKNNPQACYSVSISLLVERARREGYSTTIVVDGRSSLRFIFAGLPWIPGGQMKESVECLSDFVERFTNLGAQLVFFFDGPPVHEKFVEWRRRRLNSIKNIHNLLDRLACEELSSSLEQTVRTQNPTNIKRLTGIILKSLGCQVFRSLGDCNGEIARYAYQNQCLAILGQDTEFVIHPGARHYLSMKNFDKFRMTTLEYSGARLASSLGIEYGHLPLLASLLGDDLITRENLETFHRKLASRYCRCIKIDFKMNIQNVARFIRQYSPFRDQLMACLPELAQEVFHDASKEELLRDSIMSYDITRPPRNDITCSSGDEKWDDVRRMVTSCHKNGNFSQLYSAIIRGRYSASTCMEDYRCHDIPYNQLILKKLRQKMWGILLFEKPISSQEEFGVLELAVSGLESIDDYVFVPAVKPRVHHPGLIALWNSEEQDSTIENIRWGLLCDALDIHPSAIKSSGVPMQYMIFLLTMFFLMNEGLKLHLIELHALIASVVVLKDYTTSMLRELPSDPLDIRALRCYTLVSRSFGTVFLLNAACGKPISLNDAVMSNYQDGKLYHRKFWQAHQGSSVQQLCEGKAENVSVFNAILQFLPVDKAVIPTSK